MRPAIRVENLSKCYRIGGPKRKGRNFSEVLSDGVNSVWSKVRRLADSSVAEAGTQEFWALKDVSFEVPEGEVVGIIGRNGAGKSTLLKILSRIVEPTSGGAEIHGRLGSLLEVGTGFNPELTGRENIYLNGSILGMKKREIAAKFDEIVAFSEVEQFLDTPVKRYSSGMYVRLAFAVAAHLEPEVLIVDEVLAVGDAAFQKRCVGKMDEMMEDGRSIVFVSHHMELIRKLCRRAILLQSGRLVMCGSTEDVLSKYENEFPVQLKPNLTYNLVDYGRAGSGDVQFITFRYVPLRRCSATTDEPINFEVEVRSDRRRTINSLAVTLYTTSGVKLLNLDILSIGHPLQLDAGTNALRVSVSALHLKPGRYVLGLWAADFPINTYDHIEYLGEIDVVSSYEIEGPPSDGYVSCEFSINRIG